MKTEIVKGTAIETGIVTEIGNETVSARGTETGIITTGTEMTVGHLKTAEEKSGTGTETVTETAEEIMTALIQFTRKKRKNVWREWVTGRSM